MGAGNRPTLLEPLAALVSVIVEFGIDDDEFALGRVLAGPPELYVELERIVPTGNFVVPFLWVRGQDFERFEERVEDSEYVAAFEALDRLDDWVLYRLEWSDGQHDLLRGIEESGGVVLEANSDGGWTFRLRFQDHDALSRFYNFCTEQGLRIHIDRSYTLTERSEHGHRFGLSPEQREALLLGLRRGYFDTPSDATLEEIAAELGISQQATSDRIRRGTKQVLAEALLSRAADFE